MLNIDEIQNGIVIDHIKAGTAIGLMDLLGIAGNRTASVALIQNARSKKTASGRKDIIKVEGDASWLNLDVLAYLDPNISVTIIENGKAVRKEQPKPPKRLVNIVRCKNPRCISSIEEECDQICGSPRRRAAAQSRCQWRQRPPAPAPGGSRQCR